jgi:hypothetical protein
MHKEKSVNRGRVAARGFQGKYFVCLLKVCSLSSAFHEARIPNPQTLIPHCYSSFSAPQRNPGEKQDRFNTHILLDIPPDF